jgi:histidine ammonia-lyase
VNLVIDNLPLMLGQLRQAWQRPVRITIGDHARQAIAASSEVVAELVRHGKQVYGVNTGFGQLAQVRISDDELSHLQENLVRSHAVGVGEPIPDAVVRLVMIIKVGALAQG